MKYIFIFILFILTLFFVDKYTIFFDSLCSIAQSRSYNKIHSDSHGITEVQLRRSACYGRCPVYSVVIKSDGTFNYNGLEFVNKLGKHSGTVSKRKLNSLFQFINESKYNSFQDSYSVMVTDHSTVYTVVKTDNNEKTISNYANSGPIKLWAIEQLIDALILEGKWNSIEEENR